MRQFDQDGLSFDYLDGWSLEREETEDGWTVTVESPGRAFALICLDRSLPAAEDVATTALEALREDYPNLEASSAVETIAGEMAIGHDIDFFSLDMTNTCWTRCFYGPGGTVLVMCQLTDADDEDYEPALRALCASIRAETID